MISPSASFNSTSLPSSITTVVVQGDLLSTNSKAFQEDANPKAESLKQGGILSIDLRAARLVDSVGLNALVTTIKSAKACGGTVQLLVSHPSVLRILSFTRIDTHARVISPGAP